MQVCWFKKNCQNINCQFRCRAKPVRIVPVSDCDWAWRQQRLFLSHSQQLEFASMNLLSSSVLQLCNTQAGKRANNFQHLQTLSPAVDKPLLIFAGHFKVILKDLNNTWVIIRYTSFLVHVVSFGLFADLQSSRGIMTSEWLSMTAHDQSRAQSSTCGFWSALRTLWKMRWSALQTSRFRTHYVADDLKTARTLQRSTAQMWNFVFCGGTSAMSAAFTKFISESWALCVD